MNYKFKPSHLIPAYLFVVAVLYGGSKPPASTNTPSTDIEGDPAPTNTPPPMMMWRSRPMMSPQPELTANNQQLTTNVPWHVRGAYCDWVRVDFPSSFAFPSGTNLLTGVTVMAWGELRCNDGALAVGIRQSATTEASSLRIISLPHPVSLEPDASSFIHGLTPSNSYLFTWSNVCVNRSPTNRVDASIELFDSGAIAITTQPTNALPTTYHLPTTNSP